MKRFIPATVSLTLSLLALGSEPIFAMERFMNSDHTITVKQENARAARAELSNTVAALNEVARLAPSPYKDFANQALQGGISNQPQARKAVEWYNAEVLKSRVNSGGLSALQGTLSGGHTIQMSPEALKSLLATVHGHAEDCTRRLRELEEELRVASSAPGGADAGVIAQLRAEILRLGGNTRDVEQSGLPALNSPFIYVTGSVAAVTPEAAQAAQLQTDLLTAVNNLIASVNAGTIATVRTIMQKRKWANKLTDFTAALGSPSLDWSDFSAISRQILAQDPLVFGGGTIPETNPIFIPVKTYIEQLESLRPALEAAQSGNAFEVKQQQLQAEDATTGNLDTIADQFIDLVLPGLDRLIGATPDAILKRKLTELVAVIKTRKLGDLIKLLNEVDRTYMMANSAFLQQAIIRNGLARNPDWMQFDTVLANYKATISGLGANQKILILLHQMRHGKAGFGASLTRARAVADTAFQNHVNFITDIPDVFALIGVERKNFMDKLNTLKTTYDTDTRLLGDLVRALYYSYYEVFDSASKLFYDENPKPIVR